MKSKSVLCFGIIVGLIWVQNHALAQQTTYPWLDTAPAKTTIGNTIMPPTGFQRVKLQPQSYAAWLRNLPLKPKGTAVYLHNGQLKGNQSAHFAVVDLDTGKRNLQQCADAAIRLYSEFLWSESRDADIGFHLTNGFWVPWSRWQRGYRVKLARRNTRWVGGRKSGRTRGNFRKYLRFIMGYAGTASLAKRLPKRAPKDIQAGDLLIQGGFPGHAVVVLDIAQNKQGKRMALIGQSYMPAQDFHVLKNPRNATLSPWFALGDLASNAGLRTPEWRPFHSGDVRTMIRLKKPKK